MELQNKAFLDWAKENAVPIKSVDHHTTNQADDSDLQSIASSIGDAQVVALSEGCHNNREMMSLHHRIVKYLVENCGFTIVATESGLPESRSIWEYVQNQDEKQVDVEEVYTTGLNKMYSQWKEGRDLIEWMRSYNQTHGNRLQYYGVDIGGFYQNWKRPLDQILQYLDQVDAEYAKTLREQLQPFKSIMTENARLNYNDKLSPLEQAQLAILLDEAVNNFNTHEQDYISQSNVDDFEWAHQGMVSMQLAENYYRNISDIRSKPPNTSKYSGLNGREIAMHRNLMWILETQQRKQPGGKVKIIWINHVIHTKTETQYQDTTWGHLTPAGQMIRQSLGVDNVFIIGLLYGGGRYWKDWQKIDKRTIAPIPESKEDGLERIASAVGLPLYLLHWDRMLQLPSISASGLRFFMSDWVMRENDYFIKIAPREWDAVVYLNEVNPATPHK